jgi:putative transposase
VLGSTTGCGWQKPRYGTKSLILLGLSPLAMLAIVSALLRCLFSWLRPKHELALENIALRHQNAVLNRQAHKARLQGKDRLFWVILKGWWPNWRAALIILRPETVIGWQRAGFRRFCRWKSRHRGGRPRKDSVLIELIRRMWAVNPTWGSPRIRDELAKLGLEASTATIRKYRPKSRRQPSQTWRTFLQNHAGAIAVMDFFVVPTVTFRLLGVLINQPLWSSTEFSLSTGVVSTSDQLTVFRLAF